MTNILQASIHVPCRNPRCWGSYSFQLPRCPICGVARGSDEVREVPPETGPVPKDWEDAS